MTEYLHHHKHRKHSPYESKHLREWTFFSSAHSEVLGRIWGCCCYYYC